MKFKLMFFGIAVLLFISIASAYPQGAVAYYDFDESSGDLLDKTGNGFSGTVTGATREVNGVIGTAYRFDSFNDFINITHEHLHHVGVGNNNLTIILWINVSDNSGTEDRIIQDTGGGGADHFIGRVQTSDVRFITGGQSTVSTTNIDDGNFHFVVMRANLTGTQIFIDAVGEGTPGGAPTIGAGGGDILIGTEGTTNFFNGSMDEMGIWNRSLNLSEIEEIYNSGNGLAFQVGFDTVTVTLNNPPDSDVFVDASTIFNATIVPTSTTNLTNSTLFIYNTNSTIFASFENTITGDGVSNVTTFNVTTLTPNDYNWNVFACGTNNTGGTICGRADANFSFSFGLADFIASNRSLVYETETVVFNLSFNASLGFTPTANLYWNGTQFTGTLSSLGGTNWRASRSLEMDVGDPGIKNVFWELSLSDVFTNTSLQNQNLSVINFSQCSTNTVQYLNFTYRNETTNEESIAATISTSWQYWLGDGNPNKTFTFSTTTESNSTAFCFTPSHRSVNVINTYDYDNSESQQRSFSLDNAILNNVTSTQILYLLPTALGLFTNYLTLDGDGDTISGVMVTVTRTLNGITRTIVIDSTDGGGGLTLFLNPDFSYTYQFVKAGFNILTTTLQPSFSDTKIIVLGGSQAGGVANGTQIAGNTTYTIQPVNSSLQNRTDYTFSFEVSSSETITFISMNITNITGTQLVFQSNAGEGTISQLLNTGNHSRLFGTYIIQTSDETLVIRKSWTVGTFYIGDYSIYRQFLLFLTYEFSDFIRILLILAFITALLIYLSTNEVLETSESKIAVVVLLIWAFSLVGWLDTGIIAQTGNTSTLAQFSNQYGIAMLSTVFGLFFVLRRVFT